ncbi:hypothetical protein QFZ56_002262 [Streptomyces achromogenes]|uniref:Uncharacterized protein n=1 Tax=Streptomyces achromogenes TaxID=67255 RepID=A0ABU0PY18_STRAH|nr:hypothetical protein [Streptomyces achromogenes]
MSVGRYACDWSTRTAWCIGARLACSRADAVAAAGPRTTAVTAHSTVQGLRAALARAPCSVVCAAPVRLLFMIPTSGRFFVSCTTVGRGHGRTLNAA